MRNKINNKTGEDLLQSIAQSLAKFPNISFLANNVQNLKNAVFDSNGNLKVFTASTDTTGGAIGLVPAPPAYNNTPETTGNYSILGSDCKWHKNADTSISQENFAARIEGSSVSYANTPKKNYLYGQVTADNSYGNSSSVRTIYNAKHLYALAYKPESDTENAGILNNLNEPRVGSYRSYRNASSTTTSYITKLCLDNPTSDTVSSVSEFLLGDGTALISVSNNNVNDETIPQSSPRGSLILGNLKANNSSTYKPFILNMSGNTFKMWRKSEDSHYIKSEYTETGSKWTFNSANYFRFQNYLELTRSGNPVLPKITDITISSDALYEQCLWDGTTVGSKCMGSFLSSNELKLINSTIMNDSGLASKSEHGLFSIDNSMVLYSTYDQRVSTGAPNDPNGIFIANYEYYLNQNNVSNVALRSYLLLQKDLYISTKTSVNGDISIFPLTLNVSSPNYRRFPKDNLNDDIKYSTYGDYTGSTPESSMLYLRGPYKASTTYVTNESNIKSGNAYFFVRANNSAARTSGGAVTANYQLFAIGSAIGSNYTNNVKDILSITREYNNVYQVQMSIDAPIDFKNNNLTNIQNITATNASVSDSSANTVTTDKLIGKSSAATISSGINAKSIEVNNDTALKLANGVLYAEPSGNLKALPINETSETEKYFYRPIIITKDGTTTANTHVANAPNGYIWAWTG